MLTRTLWILVGAAAIASPSSASCRDETVSVPTQRGKAITEPLPNPRIVVKKAARELRLLDGDELVRRYRIGLGFNPVGHKEVQGDGATPEGAYFVCVKNPQSKYHLSLGLSYPNAADARAGFANGLISQRERDAIVRAERRRRQPPWNTRLGGTIFIHGEGSSSDWTWGCPALDNADMDELYAAVRVGTPVEICP